MGIIIEGPDGTGKTTLRQDLLRTFPELVPVKRHCDSDGPLTNLQHWVDASLDYSRPTHLYDRHALISEPIYGPIIRGSVADGFEDSRWYQNAWGHFLAQRPLLIFCEPPLSRVIENVQSSHQMKGVNDHIEAIYYGYHYLNLQLQVYYPRIVTWDYTHRYKLSFFDNLVYTISKGIARGGY